MPDLNPYLAEAEHVARFRRLVDEQETSLLDDEVVELYANMDFELIEKALRAVPLMQELLNDYGDLLEYANDKRASEGWGPMEEEESARKIRALLEDLK